MWYVWLFLQKHPAPENWLYKEARALFLEPEVVDCSTAELKWNEPDEDGLVQFMCDEKQFKWAWTLHTPNISMSWNSVLWSI